MTKNQVVRLALTKEIERRQGALEYCKGGMEATEVNAKGREEYAALAKENEQAIFFLCEALEEVK